MERIRINLPEAFTFSTEIPVRITDLNYGGHVGNDAFLSLIHEARQQYLHRYGYTELSFAGTSLIMSDSAIEYKKELSYGDVLKISVKAQGFDKMGFDLFYKMELIHPEGNVLAGKVKTGMRCFDYATKKVVSVPQEAINKLQQ
ncbi:acyl-CoA thioesterase [Chitinophagaceae bacterium LWZ2-11]